MSGRLSRAEIRALRSSAEYQRRRAAFLEANPLCVGCRREGRHVAGAEVDHVVPLHKGGAFWEENWQPLCRPHHEAKTADENATRRPAPPGADAWHARVASL